MRIRLIIFFCLISFSASAQIWEKLGFKKKHIVLPALPPAKGHQFVSTDNILKLNSLQAQPIVLETCEFTLVATSKMVMEQAKHNMRFRVYNDASYNFSDLAALYVKLHRWSEAKWYYLQSNNISREQNDDKHTMSNLLGLAVIKVNIGDISSARTDLMEARDLSRSLGMQTQTTDIEKQILLLAQNNGTPSKPDVKYAEGTLNAEKKAL
ncbi:MAG: hypothetical protein JST50_21820 [Bacteroidetes bacterium]|jgi:hypothetical protein|nr:hypothetical protein [Bacteroidota bacterium]